MNDWINVNGARIEKTFLEENVREARNYQWTLVTLTKPEHVHCMVCGVSVGGEPARGDSAYHSIGGWLCHYCHEHFLKSRDSS
jgi:hypothetical protein